MCQRLNARTHGQRLVNVIYPGAPPAVQQPIEDQRARWREAWGVSAEAFIVLWCGGYNTWTDVTTLFHALEQAMQRNARMHFVSAGASIYQGQTTQYDQLVNFSRQSRYAERFHLLGWRPWKDIPGIYRSADVGINIDALHAETIYGTRTRLVEMLAHDLPVISSEGCEFSLHSRSAQGRVQVCRGRCRTAGPAHCPVAEVPGLVEQAAAGGANIDPGRFFVPDHDEGTARVGAYSNPGV